MCISHMWELRRLLEEEKRVVREAVLQAGNEISRIAREGFETSYKENTDPLTTADLAANTILRERLMGAFPNDGWLSEETVDDTGRLTCERVWVVDPIDGTKEFVEGVPEYAISVALVNKGKPVLGVVYNPATEEYFEAVKGDGATLNGELICVPSTVPDKPVVLASRSELKRGEFDPFNGVFEVRPVGSIAYKLAVLAAGKADATFSLSPKNEWDIAAGVLLVEEAGGQTGDKQLKPFVFNQQNTLVTGIIATSEVSFHTVNGQIDALGLRA